MVKVKFLKPVITKDKTFNIGDIMYLTKEKALEFHKLAWIEILTDTNAKENTKSKLQYRRMVK